jgi:hypothetical protein
MPNRGPRKGSFSGLLEPPVPLPDDDAVLDAGALDVDDAGVPPRPVVDTGVRAEPTSVAIDAPAEDESVKDNPTGTGQLEHAASHKRGATTVRLRPAAANALYDAWITARRNEDPRLSYPEFASKVVVEGLRAGGGSPRQTGGEL